MDFRTLNNFNIKIEADKIVLLGKPNSRKFLPQKFRLLTTYNTKSKKHSYVLTNIFDLSAEEIVKTYKRRWDIEVFFRFLKQELNFNQFGSTSTNGIKVMMYSTLIASMLVMIYKKLNQVGFKTAIRRIAFELNDLIITMVVKQCGGDPALFFR
ncbi:IS4/IS5 family transposase [Marinilabiliaceae bacterium JC017]|nr:IS4/IS5 family transposase [Marinilabiliaceae bacterium JC017]